MAESNAAVRRVDLDDGLPPREQIRILLAARGFPTVAAFAKAAGVREQEYHNCLSRRRPYPEVRDAIAKTTGKSRRFIDALIDRSEPVATVTGEPSTDHSPSDCTRDSERRRARAAR